MIEACGQSEQAQQQLFSMAVPSGPNVSPQGLSSRPGFDVLHGFNTHCNRHDTFHTVEPLTGAQCFLEPSRLREPAYLQMCTALQPDGGSGPLTTKAPGESPAAWLKGSSFFDYEILSSGSLVFWVSRIKNRRARAPWQLVRSLSSALVGGARTVTALNSVSSTTE